MSQAAPERIYRGVHAADRRAGRRERLVDAGLALRCTAREHCGEALGSQADADLTSPAIVASLAELIMEWLQDNLAVSRERLIDHCAALVLAVAPVTSEPNPTAIGGAPPSMTSTSW